MCVHQHRLDVIQEIKKLKDDVPIICISTQLIEAGGMLILSEWFDLMLTRFNCSSKGRCNREGKRDLGQVTLINLSIKKKELTPSLKKSSIKKRRLENILIKKRHQLKLGP